MAKAQRWQQLDMFGDNPNYTGASEAGLGGPVKSIAEKRDDMRERILDFISSRGRYGATTDEIQKVLKFSPKSISARCSELKTRNLVTVSNDDRLTRSGRYASVFIARGVK